MPEPMPPLLPELYAGQVTAVGDRPDTDFELPTRTAWTVRELLFHQMLPEPEDYPCSVTGRACNPGRGR